MFFKIHFGVLGAIKKLIYSSKSAVESVLMALATHSRFVKWLQDGGKLLKNKLVVGYKAIVLNTIALFRYMGVIELLYILFAINSLYNRAKI